MRIEVQVRKAELETTEGICAVSCDGLAVCDSLLDERLLSSIGLGWCRLREASAWCQIRR